MRLPSALQTHGPLSGDSPRPPRNPVTIEVIAYAPVAFFHCMHRELLCRDSGARPSDRREQLDPSLPEDPPTHAPQPAHFTPRPAHPPRPPHRLPHPTP